MYEPVGYETYADTDAFISGVEAQIPVEGSVARGWEPYDYPDTNDGYEAAKAELMSPLALTDENGANGKELYGIYCAVCHGGKGDGQGILMTREKFLGVPSYADREITPGSIYHTIDVREKCNGISCRTVQRRRALANCSACDGVKKHLSQITIRKINDVHLSKQT